MTEIILENITKKADLGRYEYICAVTPNGEAMLIWESGRLVPFVGPDHPGTLMERGYVQVPSFAPEDLAPLYAKLTEIDGDRRLQR